MKITTFRHGEESLRIMGESGEVKWCPREDSKIAEFYKGKNVFVTGATGYLGKLLVEKLLRACPELNAIYILVRPKKGEDEHGRVDKLYSDPIFGPLTKLFPKFQHKINILKGDVCLPNLGLSPESVSIITEKINVIFHGAATVRFDEKINVAISINVRGTRDLLKIAKKCINLESYVHISTAFAYCNQKEIDEVFYKTPYTADEVIEMVETLSEKAMIEKTAKLIQDWPNTYVFTKAISENAVATYGQGLPICVVRPSIVIATYKEPLRSWIDNLYGATGIVVGAGTGLLKTIHCDKKNLADLVPGDYVINSLIAASYKRAKDKVLDNIPVYNYVSSVENPQTWEEFMDQNRTWGTDLPVVKCVWYYNLTLNKFALVHYVYTFFLHFIPGVIMDLGLILAGHRPIMVKIYKKIVKFESVIAYFSSNQWQFHNNNTQNLWNSLEESDKKMFPFTIKDLNWNEYYKTHILGLRTYLIKEDISTLPQAMVRWTRFYIADKIVKSLFYFVIMYIGYTFLSKLLTGS